MRSLPITRPVAFAAVALLGVMSGSARAEQTARQAIAGRQQVRAELAVAMSDGKLTTRERLLVLEKGEHLLPEAEFEGLKQALGQLALRYGPNTTRAKASTPAETPTVMPGIESSSNTLAQYSSSSVDRLVDGVAYDEPTPADPSQSPFEDEQPEMSPEGMSGGIFDERVISVEEGTPYEISEEGISLTLDGDFVVAKTCSSFMEAWNNSRMSTSVTAFKGPMDLDNENGNFGVTFGFNGAIPVARRLGIGIQGGTSGVLTDFHGTQFTNDRIRSQNFTTVGLFQRIPCGAGQLSWGFAYDWMFDRYYDELEMSQWRVQMGYDISCFSQIGIWANIPNSGDAATLGDPARGPVWQEQFKPVAQGNFYLRHLWESGAITTSWVGLSEEPGEMILGTDVEIPMSCRLSLVGGFDYMLPSANAARGQDEEMWNVTIGFEFRPGGVRRGLSGGRFSPLLPLADNGTFAIRRY